MSIGNNKKLNNLLINEDCSIRETMAAIDRNALGAVLIVKSNKDFMGLITDGDIRRAILNGIDINNKIIEITNLNPVVLQRGKFFKFKSRTVLTQEDIKMITPAGGFLKIPEIDENSKVKGIKFVDPETFKFKAKDRPVKKALIVGGAGYLGSVLCHKLLAQGYQVRVLDSLTYTDSALKDLCRNNNFEFLKGDIRNISDICRAVNGTDAVIHLAAIVGDPACALDSEKTIEINYLSAKTIAEVCRFNQINRFLFASTCSVYGASQNPDEKLKEDSEINPVSLYARMKLESEKAVLSLFDSNFSPTIFRFATLFGLSPRMRFDLVVNLLTLKALKEKKFTILGGNQYRPNLSTSDAALAISKWLEAPIEKVRGKIFNAGENSQNFQIVEIGKMVKKAVPEAKMEIREKEGDKRNYNVCFDKINQVLGFKAEKTIEQGILEIKNFIESRDAVDFNSPAYNNYNFLLKNVKDV